MCIPNDLEELEMPFSRGLDGGSEWEYFLPVRPGDTITVTQAIIDFTEKHGRLGTMLIETRQNSFVNQRGRARRHRKDRRYQLLANLREVAL